MSKEKQVNSLDLILKELDCPTRAELESFDVVLTQQPDTNFFWYSTNIGSYTFMLVKFGEDNSLDMFDYKKFYPVSKKHSRKFQHYINSK